MENHYYMHKHTHTHTHTQTHTYTREMDDVSPVAQWPKEKRKMDGVRLGPVEFKAGAACGTAARWNLLTPKDIPAEG